MTNFLETLHRQHLERQLKFMRAAISPKLKPRPPIYEIPNTPFGVPKINPQIPIEISDTWVERQKKLHSAHKEPWFQIEDGPREFDQQAEPAPLKSLGVLDIQRAVCEHYGLSRTDLLSERRGHHFARPRQVAMYLTKRLTTKSYPEIGRRFGDRDHSTAIHAIRITEQRRRLDQRLQASIEMLVDRLGGDPP